jgi:hypothetical protein
MRQRSVIVKPAAGRVNEVDITPGPARTLEAFRELGYRSIAAICDLVDNCLDAGATRIDVEIIATQRESKYVGHVVNIIDNGGGMDAATLQEAIRIGSQRVYNPTDLGRFGVGLVAAGLSLGENLRVASIQQGGVGHEVILDLSLVRERGAWVAASGIAKRNDLERIMPHGTIVSISKIDRIDDTHPGRFRDKLMLAMGRIYRRYIDHGTKFYVNNHKVVKIDPLMLDDPRTERVVQKQITFAPGKTAELRIVDVPDDEDAPIPVIDKHAGFYLLRNGREVLAAETFGISGNLRHHVGAHFRAELEFSRELDEFFHVSVKKDDVQFDDRLIARLKEETEKYILASVRRDRESAVPSTPLSPKLLQELQSIIDPKGSQREGGTKRYPQEKLGEKSPVVVRRDHQMAFNLDHPFLRLLSSPLARQKPALVFGLMMEAIAAAEETTHNGRAFVANFDASLRKIAEKAMG